ncbi:MAG: response regulator [Acidobacteriota bacterium]
MRLFLVDDSISVRKAVERMLTGRGIEVVGASNGQEAIDGLVAAAPQVVVCDLVMPEVNGFEVCEFIRRSPALAEVPVVFISGIVDDETRRRADDVGANSILKKPFTNSELLSTIERFLPTGEREKAPEIVPLEEPSLAIDGILRSLDRLGGLRFGMLLGEGDEILREFGAEESEGLAGRALLDLLEATRMAVREVAGERVDSLILESPSGLVVARAVDATRCLLLVMGSQAVLGQARMQTRQVAARLAAHFAAEDLGTGGAGPAVEASEMNQPADVGHHRPAGVDLGD